MTTMLNHRSRVTEDFFAAEAPLMYTCQACQAGARVLQLACSCGPGPAGPDEKQ
jgi:hypothetical protein